MKNLLKLMPLLVLPLFFACEGSGQQSKDIPDYALGETSYFADREGKDAHAFLGFSDARLGYEKYGLLDNGRNLSGDIATVDGKNIVLLYASSNSYGRYLIEKDSVHIMHILWNEENPKNQYNISLANGSSIRNFSYKNVDGNYSDSYFFAKRKDMAEAIEYLKTLEKQPNQPSQYIAKEHGGTKTYKAKIGKSVKYFGNDSLDAKQFQSLYLDCGAVVEYHYKGSSPNLVGKTIDCVTNDRNKVITYQFITD